MRSVVFTVWYFFGFISCVTTLNCVSCVGWSHSGCNDPYDENTSGNLPVPGNIFCAKVIYPTYIERIASGRSCTPGNGVGGSIRYCCSDKDYCNSVFYISPNTINYVILTGFVKLLVS